MTFELGTLFGIGVMYLMVLFLIAHATERGWVPERVVKHPATYVLSLGVYATSWTYYGSVGFAQSQGFNFLTIYLGVTLAFILAPTLLLPILRLTRDYQLSSVADLFAFRYRSQVVGVFVTLFMLAGTLPYIALQIRAVTESMRVLSQEVAPSELALIFCVTLILFAILFGARHISAREKHEGLVVAIAFESVVKLTALLAVGAFAIFGVFDGVNGLNNWLGEHPEAIDALYAPMREGPWTTLLLLSFAAAFLLPRQFHMTFTENMDERALSVASWGFPLFLLLLNLAILPVLWAGTKAQVATGADYYVLGITLSSGSVLLPTVAFVGGLSAASAMMIVTTLALSAMCLNHLLLPASYPDPYVDLYRWLLWARRIIIAVIIMLGYGFYLLLEHNQGLVQLGLISFVAVAQFLPGIIGLLFWRRATRYGVLAGLTGGAAIWFFTLLLPLLERSGIVRTTFPLAPIMETMQLDQWELSTFWSVSINAVLFVVVSLLTRNSAEEREAAEACCRDTLTPPRGVVRAQSPAQFKEQLARILGSEAAESQVRQALADLGMSGEERRPTELRRLRERIERNLSGLMGPLLARMIVDERLGMDPGAETVLASNVRFIEQRLEASHVRLRGLAAELDALRRYHRQILHDLPLGVCSLGPDREIVIWNLAMELISGVDRNQAVGAQVSELPAPWAGLLDGFLRTGDMHLRKLQANVDGRTRWFNLHKATIEEIIRAPRQMRAPLGTVVLIEDLTDLHMLENELAHSERLASIGRLAAGVAHEVGNPVTGIACLAQNIKAETDDATIRESIEQILKQTGRISRIVQSLVSFSHSGSTGDHLPAVLKLHGCVEDAIRLVQLSHTGKQLSFVNACEPQLQVYGDQQRLAQVFVNLLSNACDASRPGDCIELRTSESGNFVRIDVLDQGTGIDPEHLDSVFEPFFTTKPAGQGTGLGLPMVYNIIQEHGGSVTMENREHGGLCVSLLLPKPSDPSAAAVIESKSRTA